MKYDICPICGSPAKKEHEAKSTTFYYSCLRCGKFNIHDMFMYKLKDLNDIKIANISGWIRENQGEKIILDENKIESLKILRNLTVFEKADKTLLFLSQNYPIPGVNFDFKFSDINSFLIDIFQGKYKEDIGEANLSFMKKYGRKILSLVAISRSIDFHEFSFIWSSYLRIEKKYISDNSASITPKGWAHIESLQQRNPNSKNVFIAMWFSDDMFEVFNNFIVKAVIEAGFNAPKHIGKKEHNNDINDEIIAEINSSRFVVADFTGNRGGVYYESGYARGLKIPVIYTCREDWFNKFIKQSVKIKYAKGNEKDKIINSYSQIHFDVNHQNFILWNTGEELKEKLANRIKATII